jgi:hypothetical protein
VYVRSPDVVREQANLTPLAFARLLTWLDDGVDSNGERYFVIRRRLVSDFDRRNRPAARCGFIPRHRLTEIPQAFIR